MMTFTQKTDSTRVLPGCVCQVVLAGRTIHEQDCDYRVGVGAWCSRWRRGQPADEFGRGASTGVADVVQRGTQCHRRTGHLRALPGPAGLAEGPRDAPGSREVDLRIGAR